MALRSTGLRVVTAVDGADAVRLFQLHEGNVALVLLDVQMPELNGPQAFEALRALAPDVRVLFMSGGSREHSVEDLLATGAIGFLPKPFRDLNEVANRLRKLVTTAAHAR
jgi:CheY-like chemotaxis protein